MNLKALLLLSFLGMCLGKAALSQTTRVEPTQMPKGTVPLPMSVEGRVKTETAEADSPLGGPSFVYQWPGVYFEAAFRGRELFFRTGDGKQGLHLAIDDQPTVAFISSHKSAYHVTGLTRGVHTVRLAVVTESQAGPASFGGFAVPAKELSTPEQKRSRQIEFIGDSYTVGYGNTSGKPNCSREEIWSTTDNSVAFGPEVAKSFGADYQVNAISGRGVVRNYNGGKSDTLPQAYPFLLFDKKELYRDTGWHPQVVVIGLGTNDFSTPLAPGERWKTREELHAAYESGFVSLVGDLRERNPSALIILWSTDGERGEIQTEASNVARQLKAAGDAQVEFVSVSGLQMTGCDGHPSTVDDRSIADRLQSVIRLHPEVWQQKPAPVIASARKP